VATGALQRFEQATDALHDVTEVLDVALPGVVLEALVEVGHLFAMLLQIGATGVGHLVYLAVVLFDDARVPELFEHLQCGIDHTGARAVRTAAALFDDLNDFVPVTRTLGERVEHEVANAAALSARGRRAEPIAPGGRATAAGAVRAKRTAGTERATTALGMGPAIGKVGDSAVVRVTVVGIGMHFLL
jgi:hypothetical protein